MRAGRRWVVAACTAFLAVNASPAAAQSDLQSCYDWWRALAHSSSAIRSASDDEELAARLAHDYAEAASKAIHASIIDRNGAPPAAETEQFTRLSRRTWSGLEAEIPSDCRAIEGVGRFADRDAIRRLKYRIETALLARDWERAVSLARPYAEQGDPGLQVILGRLYASENGDFPRDLDKAADWFAKAAGQSHPEGLLELGLMQVRGDVGGAGPSDGVRLIRRAAEAGLADAQIVLADVYLRGAGGPADASESTRWLLRAAQGGAALAQATLGVRYANGEGLPRDLVKAWMWMDIAARQPGSDRPQIIGLRDQIEGALGAAETERARGWSIECVRRHLRRCDDMDAAVAAAQADARAAAAARAAFADFLDGPWGEASAEGEPSPATQFEGLRPVYGRASCPASGLSGPGALEENEVWFAKAPDGALLQKFGEWGGGAGGLARLEFVGMTAPDTAEFSVLRDMRAPVRMLIRKVSDTQIHQVRYDVVTFEQHYIRCRRG